MQTFLPYADAKRSAQVLDYRRLGKQRVEAFQIYKIVSGERSKGGWINHPAVIMWRGYKDALAVYHNTMIDEWVARGYNNTMAKLPVWKVELPPWWGDEEYMHPTGQTFYGRTQHFIASMDGLNRIISHMYGKLIKVSLISLFHMVGLLLTVLVFY